MTVSTSKSTLLTLCIQVSGVCMASFWRTRTVLLNTKIKSLMSFPGFCQSTVKLSCMFTIWADGNNTVSSIIYYVG
jgi:hypothetical protein